jgi:hypothetical protein
MKRILAFLALPLLGAVSLPQESGVEEQETELGRHMHALEDALKALRRGLREGAAPAVTLEALATMEEHALRAKELVPASAARVPEPERDAFVRTYRRTMVDFLTRQLELEAALLDGDADGVQAALERVRAMEDSAHERFAPEEH